MASQSELAPGITSLSDALSLAVAWLDGDVATINASAAANNNNGGDSSQAASTSDGDAAKTTTQHQQTPIEKALALLSNLQTEVSRAGLLSKNESLDDVPTSSLELLSVEYHLGRAHLMLPTHTIVAPPANDNDNDANNNNNNGSHCITNSGPSPSLLRKRNVTRAMEYYHSFLKTLEQLGEDIMSESTVKEYHTLLDLEDIMNSNNDTSSSSTKKQPPMRMNPSQVREMKIQRFQRKKATTQKRAQLQSQLQRRSRLGMADDEPMEGHDLESLSRTLFIETLRMHAEESLEELQSSKGELEMLEMAMKMESARMNNGGGYGGMMDPRMNRGMMGRPPPQSAGRYIPGGPNDGSNQPLQMTQITENPITGQLELTKQQVSNGQLRPVTQQIQRQEISNGVFKPSWNLPTMSLEELGDRERAEAIQRGEQQKLAEAEAKFKPKRYDQLEKDGMEDNAELVEASARLDREWDDWKDENPRGSGNKMGERGDRNF